MTVPSMIDWRAVAEAELHRLRIRIIDAAAGRDRIAASELAVEFDEPIGNVSYHVRELVKAGVLAEAGTEQRRGAVKHFYRLADEMKTAAMHVKTEARDLRFAGRSDPAVERAFGDLATRLAT